MPGPQRLLFGSFLLDLLDERLWHGTEAVRVGSKALHVLRCLTTTAGQLVTKEALLATVWPETPVGEAVVAVAIRELRQALGDVARTPQFIETVHGRGYRFIAPVTVADASLATRHTTADAPTERLTAPDASGFFVGREAELACLHQWRMTALQGRRQVGFVAGAPGIGKTTLVDTFTAHLDTNPEAVWVGYGQCVDHYGIGEAYLPIVEALGRLCQRAGGDAFVTLLRQYAPSWLVQMPALLTPSERHSLEHLTRQVTQISMIRELAEALEVLTKTHLLVLVFEDLHWSDPSTLAFLSYVARRREPARLLILGTYRPGDVLIQQHPLGRMLTELRLHQQCVDIRLDDLPEAEVATYLQQRFGLRRVPEALLHLLYQRCSGNPLFLVALVDALVHQGILHTQTHTLHLVGGLAAVSSMVPESVQQLIAQHVGQLSPQEQALLEAASVAGMTFSTAAVAAGVPLGVSDIETQLTTWGRQGRFVQAHGTETWPDGTVSARYAFHHALYHEVILRRISPGQCVHLHRVIGTRKEQAYTDQTALIAAELAAHFEVAQELHRAVLYRKHAAENALQRSAHDEAIAHLMQGLRVLGTLPETRARDQQELLLCIDLGKSHAATKGWASPETAAAYTRAWELCQHTHDTSWLFAVLWGLSQVYIVRADLTKHREVSTQFFALAAQRSDAILLVVAYWLTGVNLWHVGDFATALAQLEQAYARYDPQHHATYVTQFGVDLGVFTLSYLSHALWGLGYPQQAVERSREALALAHEVQHPFSLALAQAYAAMLQQFRRKPLTAHTHVELALSVCAKHGFAYYLAWATIIQGWVLAAAGRREEGRAQLQQGLTTLQATGGGLRSSYYLVLLAAAEGEVGQAEKGLRVLEEASRQLEHTQECWVAAPLSCLQGDLWLAVSPANPLAAEACFHQALEVASSQHAKSWELRAATGLARLWQAQGKRQAAYDLLIPVYNWFTEGFDTADLQEAKQLLATLSEERS